MACLNIPLLVNKGAAVSFLLRAGGGDMVLRDAPIGYNVYTGIIYARLSVHCTFLRM